MSYLPHWGDDTAPHPPRGTPETSLATLPIPVRLRKCPFHWMMQGRTPDNISSMTPGIPRQPHHERTPSRATSLASLLQRRGASFMVLSLTCLAPWLSGCAEPVARPDLTLPRQDASELDPIDPTEPPGTDVRTIEDTGEAPDGPISPAGSSPAEEEPAGPGIDQGIGQAAPVPYLLASDAATESIPSSDGYRTLGGVLAEVNGRPIYTDEIIAAVRNELRGLARRFARDDFTRRAEAVLANELASRISDEKSRLVAERNVADSDKARARMIATSWRQKQITAAGGSEARARQIALEESGMSLEKLAEQAETRTLFLMFMVKTIVPRAQPSAAEIREYYERHRNDFNQPGEMQFQIIEFNTEDGDAPEQLRVRAEHVRELALEGEDFEALAREYNDNELYRDLGGRLPEFVKLDKPGQFRWPAVDAAAWSLEEGQVSEVISEENGRRLFLIKVLSKSRPGALSFAEAQERIGATLTNRRKEELLGQYLSEVERYAVVTPPEQIERAMQTALEVVEQQYDTWRNDTE